MFKKFIDGLIFGCGFTISFITLIMIVSMTLPRVLTFSNSSYDKEVPIQTKKGQVENSTEPKAPVVVESKIEKNFHELSVEEKIEKSNVIFLTRFEPSKDGEKLRAIITDIFKQEPGVEVKYKIGDEYQDLSYYPSADNNRGDGFVVFYAGSPAIMMSATSYRGDRITGLSDIPIALFRKKCGA